MHTIALWPRRRSIAAEGAGDEERVSGRRLRRSSAALMDGAGPACQVRKGYLRSTVQLRGTGPIYVFAELCR